MPEKAKQRKISRWENLHNPEQVTPRLLLIRRAANLSGIKHPSTRPLLKAFDGIKSEETVTDFIIALKKAAELRGIRFPESAPHDLMTFDVAESEKAATNFIAKREKMHNPNLVDRRLLVTEMAAKLSGVTLERAVQLLGKNERC